MFEKVLNIIENSGRKLAGLFGFSARAESPQIAQRRPKLGKVANFEFSRRREKKASAHGHRWHACGGHKAPTTILLSL